MSARPELIGRDQSSTAYRRSWAADHMHAWTAQDARRSVSKKKKPLGHHISIRAKHRVVELRRQQQLQHVHAAAVGSSMLVGDKIRLPAGT